MKISQQISTLQRQQGDLTCAEEAPLGFFAKRQCWGRV
jgi:hypothetical protein